MDYSKLIKIELDKECEGRMDYKKNRTKKEKIRLLEGQDNMGMAMEVFHKVIGESKSIY